MQTTAKKKFTNFPFAHRQHTHSGHCAKIHGHSWDFEFEFKAETLDSNGFILDFGELGWLKEWLDRRFDHTLVLSQDDPLLNISSELYSNVLQDVSNVTIVASVSCEGIADYTFRSINALLFTYYQHRVILVAVTVWESPNNSATIRNGNPSST